MPYQEPEFLPWDGRRVPMTFVGGYLGAGKTTLVNEVLRRTDRPIAVLVNDIGAVDVDRRLIAARSGDTIELSDGCICCSLVDGFGAAIDQVRARPEPPDQLIVELSGVAQADRILPWGKSAGFRLDGLVVVVAADTAVDLAADQMLGDALRSQMAAADLLVVSKTDLVDARSTGEVDRLLDSVAPGIPRISSGGEAAAALVALGGRRPGGPTDLPAPTLFDRHRSEIVDLPNPMVRGDLETFLAELPDSVVRAKGIVALVPDSGPFSADDRELVLVQVVGDRVEISPLPGPERTEPTGLVLIQLLG